MTTIGILVPVCSRNQSYKSLEDTPFSQNFLNSFNKTKETTYTYTIYVGIDSTDGFYNDNIETLKNIGTTPVILSGCEHKPAHAWNALLEKAYDDGCEYFFQIGDDVELMTERWTSTFIEKLQEFKNVGLVGPLDEKGMETRIKNGYMPLLENAFFHRTHYEIFGTLFHTYIENHHCDDWLYEVYSFFERATIMNDVKCKNITGDCRYVSKNVLKFLNLYVLEGVLKLSNYLSEYETALRNIDRLLEPKNTIIFIDTRQISQVPPESQSGVHRVVNNITKQFCILVPNVVLITMRCNGQLCTNNRYKEKLFNMKKNSLGKDTNVDLKAGDILFLIDPIMTNSETQSYFSFLKSSGLTIVSLVHDVIPITFPHYVSTTYNKMITDWFDSLGKISSGIVCVSQTTKDEILKLNPSLDVKPFHLGSDLDALGESKFSYMPQGKNVLMVGTIEPRKCHRQTLDAFCDIWEKNPDINLIIVGHHGWLTNELLHRIYSHPLLNKKLFLQTNATDSDLIYIYKNSDLFLFSSDVEGFGIPLIEAANYGLPLLLRDRKIFREIAGDNAIYFSEFDELTSLIPSILSKETHVPSSKNIKTNTWEDSAVDCLKHLLKFRVEHLKKLNML